jgi:PhnB protein
VTAVTEEADMSVPAIPDNYPQLSPYLCVDDAAAAIDFYASVLGAEERIRIPAPEAKIGHSELQIGTAVVMVSDATMEAAVAAGAQMIVPVEDRFYGDRSGQFLDSWGHRWSVATHIEDVSHEELLSRAEALFG